MCGIAGVVNLTGSAPVPSGMLEEMADALYHRGPDEDGYFRRSELGMASRRLSIIGLKGGRQPLSNEDRSLSVVFHGELFDYPEVRAQLPARGHRFVTHCDAALLPP